MQFITSLFGGSGNSFLTAAFALGAVLIAIVLVLWAFKAITQATGNVTRGRNKRLSVVDTLALDPKRQLLIVRRDNVEHLILIGGPQDVVVETGIAVAEAAPAPALKRTPAAPIAPRPVPVAPPAKPAVAPPVTAVDQLRESGKSTNKKQHLSLRHTGLLRPVNEPEVSVSPENSPAQVQSAADSAKEDKARRDVEGTDLVEDSNESNRT